jgi:hypothetical protein
MIRAKGEAIAGVYPIMQLWIDGHKKVEWNVGSNVMDYRYDEDLCSGNHTIDIVYTNDCLDRNLYVYYLQVGDIIKYTTESGVIYDAAARTGHSTA